MLHGRGALTLGVLNGSIYAIGGIKFPKLSLSVVEKYDSSTGSWE